MSKIRFNKLLIFALIIAVSFAYVPQAQAWSLGSVFKSVVNTVAKTVNTIVNTVVGVTEIAIGYIPGLGIVGEDGRCRLENLPDNPAKLYYDECGGGGPGSTGPGGNSIVGACGDTSSPSGINTCSSGILGENHAQSGGIYDWYCMGINGGSNSGLCRYIPGGGGSGSDCGTSGCGGCVSGGNCTAACRNAGFGSVGWCAIPGSTDPGACCACGNSCPVTPYAPPYCPPSTSYGGWSDCNAACHNYGSQSRGVSGNNSDCSTFSYTDTQSCYVSCPPACSFSANPSTIVLPQTSTLSWSCQYAEYGCSINNEIGSVNLNSGSVEVSPPETTTYTLGCSGIDGSGSWNTTVTNAFEPIIREVIPR